MDNIINKLTDYISREKLEKIISIIIYILKNFKIKTIFKKPKKVIINFLIEYKKEILDYMMYLITAIISFINEYFSQLKVFILPFGKNIADVIFNNIEFINNFHLLKFKEYFSSTKNAIYNKVSETYDGIKKSENTKKIIDNVKYSANIITETSGKIVNKGINKIKDISKSETINNIKSSCADAANYVENSFKVFFS